MNPLHAHWLRMALWLLVAAPVIAVAVVLSTGAGFDMALAVTLYMWIAVCVILALIAFAGVVMRVLGRGMRALRR